MTLFIKTLLISSFILLQSCIVFIPQEDKQQPYRQDCRLVTKQLDLGTLTATPNRCSGASCFGMPIASGLTTFIVSGSIVLTNNILHWTEYQGRCVLFDQDGKSLPYNPISAKKQLKKNSSNTDKQCLMQCDIETNICTCYESPSKSKG